MEERFANLRRIDFTWVRRTKKLKLRREEVPPLNNSPSHPVFEIPVELTLHIISFLNSVDVLSLGCCSKLLNQLCNYDSEWRSLYLKRWPDHLEVSHISCLNAREEWKDSYISKHKVMAATVSDLFRWSAKVKDVRVRCYRDKLSILTDTNFGFEDVCLLFRKKHSVHLNLIGLHFAIRVLGVPRNDLIDALSRYQVADRQVFVYWKLTDEFSYLSSYTPDHYALTVSLYKIANGEEAILEFLEYKRDRASKLRVLRIASY